MTASAEGLREARDVLLRVMQDEGIVGRKRQRIENAADWMVRAALRDTGPRPDSDPWPDLDGSEGPWRDDQGYWLGGMGTPDTGPRPDHERTTDGAGRVICCEKHAAEPRPDSGIDVERLALIHRPVTNPWYPRPICEDDGQEWPCKTAIVARLSTPRTESRR